MAGVPSFVFGRPCGRGRGVLGIQTTERTVNGKSIHHHKDSGSREVECLPTKSFQSNDSVDLATLRKGMHDSHTLHTTQKSSVSAGSSSNCQNKFIAMKQDPAISPSLSNTSGYKSLNSSHVKEGAKLMAKYSYKANLANPYGFRELSIVQKETLYFLRTHQSDSLWWEVRNDMGGVGYVPGSYCMVIKDEVSSLPWLAERQEEFEKAEQERLKGEEAKLRSGDSSSFGAPPGYKSTPKAYVSAYTENKASSSDQKYYCDVCDKNLNGPQPYKMHMASKAHREELDYRGLK